MRRRLEIKNPRTGKIDFHIDALEDADIALLEQKARAAQKNWLSVGLEHRIHKILGFTEALETHADIIIKAIEIDTGRRRMAHLELQGVIGNLKAWAELVPRLMPKSDWTQGRSKPNFKHLNAYQPYALVGIISPWNFPITLSFIDAIPALLAGGCVMIKPSEVTPRFAESLKPVIEEVGLEDNIIFVQGDGVTGAALIDHVDCICFTGSVPTGRKVAIKAAQNLIPANLELGGKDPLIITTSADMNIAADLALRSSVLATGQACQSIERIYVPRVDYSAFTSLLAKKARAVKLNWPNFDQGHIGPFIFDKQADIIAAQIADAVKKGAKILSGGKILNHGGGKWLEPTVISDVNHQMDIMRKETFGPIMPVMAYGSIEEAITLANDSEYGLSGGVYAASIDEALKIGQHIDAGAISLMDGALTGQYFEAAKQAFKNSGLGASRMGAAGLLRFFRQKAYIANTISPLTIDDFAE